MIPVFLPRFRPGLKEKEYMEIEELPFAWSFTTRTSPEDETPLMEKYDLYEERLKSFNSLKKFYASKVELLAKFGFYFSPKPNCGAIICFSCGTYTFVKEDAVIQEKKCNRPYVKFYHHHHCPFMNNLVEKNYDWVKSSEKQIEFAPRDLHEAMLEKVRKSIAEKRAAGTSERPEHYFENSNETLEQPKICIVCQKTAVEISFHPCGHNGSCIKCAKLSSECHSCHEKYTGLVREYIYNFKNNVDTKLNVIPNVDMKPLE